MNKVNISMFLCAVLISNSLFAMESSYSQDQASPAKLLHAICNGPRSEDHPFYKAGFITHDAQIPYAATVVTYAQDPMSCSMIALDQQCLDSQGELKEKETQIKVRKVLQHLKPQGTMALVCVHGTYSKESGFGMNLAKKSTHSIIDFAKKLGVAHHRAVQIVSFIWSGLLDIESRKEAGKQLAAYLMRKNKFEKVWTVAHSHGCNVVNWAAFYLLEEGYAKQIDTAIHLASPVPDLQIAKPVGLEQAATHETIFNMKKLIHFYGSHDFSAIIGSLHSAWQSGRKTRPGRDSICTAYNVRTQLNGQPLDHLNIKSVIEHLPGLLHAIDTYYTCFFDLDANLIKLEDGSLEYPVVANRKISDDPHHPALRENYRRTLAYSQYQQDRYKQLYGQQRSISDKSSIYWRMIAAPWQEYWGRAEHDKQPEKDNEK